MFDLLIAVGVIFFICFALTRIWGWVAIALCAVLLYVVVNAHPKNLGDPANYEPHLVMAAPPANLSICQPHHDNADEDVNQGEMIYDSLMGRCKLPN